MKQIKHQYGVSFFTTIWMPLLPANCPFYQTYCKSFCSAIMFCIHLTDLLIELNLTQSFGRGESIY